MPPAVSSSVPTDAANGDGSNTKPAAYLKVGAFVGILVLDAITSVVVLAPLWPWMRRMENVRVHYTLYASLIDLAVLAALRIAASCLAMLVSYWKAEIPAEYHTDLFHPNGERKTREQLEQEAVEEAFWPWFKRLVVRPSFAAEILAAAAQILCVFKCLARMNVEIGTLHDSMPIHPVFWLAVLGTAIFSMVEASYLEETCTLAGQYGKETGSQPPEILRNISSHLLAPLLDDQNGHDVERPVNGDNDVGAAAPDDADAEENARATSDITADPAYRASWSDLLMMCYPDVHLISAAFVFLFCAALAQVLIPRYLGNILDALAAAFGNPDDDSNRHKSMWEVTGFMTNVKLLVVASVLAGVFAGLRGSIFVRYSRSGRRVGLHAVFPYVSPFFCVIRRR